MFTLNCKGRLLELDKPVVMGIINTTPDSFYAGSRAETTEHVLETAGRMLEEGAAILDIGGQSTRPGAEQVSPNEEAIRVTGAIAAVKQRFPESFVSVDTYHAAVARQAVEAGADMVNDISGGGFDHEMLQAVAALCVPYVCMHLKGSPQTMHSNPSYHDVTTEVLDYFIERIDACTKAGIHDVIVDPGFGFSKTSTHNFQLLKELESFSVLRRPLLLGISRKSTIYKTLGITPAESLNGTTVLNTAGLLRGANILRVHDVKEAVEAVKLTDKIK